MVQVPKLFQDLIEYIRIEIESARLEDYRIALFPLIFIPIIFGPGFVIKIFSGLFPKPKCKICGQRGEDVLSENSDHELGKFCRNHLLQEYSRLFLNFHFNKVMVEFQPKASGYLGPVYGYYPVSEIEKYGWEKKSRQIVENLLLTINGKQCKACNRSATTLFVSKEVAPWSKYGPEPSLEYARIGEYLCNDHALDKVKPSIQNNPQNFYDGGGLWLPYKEGGLQVGTEL